MLLASSVNTPIDNNRSHLLALHVRVLCELGLRVCLKHAVFKGVLWQQRHHNKIHIKEDLHKELHRVVVLYTCHFVRILPEVNTFCIKM